MPVRRRIAAAVITTIAAGGLSLGLVSVTATHARPAHFYDGMGTHAQPAHFYDGAVLRTQIYGDTARATAHIYGD